MPLTDQIEEFSRQLRTSADLIDQGMEPPREQLQQLADCGYYQYTSTAEPPQRRRLLDHLASGCGVTSFLSTQHEGACRRLLKAEHPLFEEAAKGKIWVGVCFAHLRRNPCPVTVKVSREDLTFAGQGPWFSGLGVMDRLLVGGASAEGAFYMAHTLLKQKGIKIGMGTPLAVMNATATVPLTFEELKISRSEVVVLFNAPEMALADMHSTVYQSARSLGVTRAAAQYLPSSSGSALKQRIEEQHAKMDQWDRQPSWPTATKLRVEAIQLASQAVQAAFMNVGGRSHALNHPLQRLAREASFYSTTQLTGHLKEAALKELRR